MQWLTKDNRRGCLWLTVMPPSLLPNVLCEQNPHYKRIITMTLPIQFAASWSLFRTLFSFLRRQIEVCQPKQHEIENIKVMCPSALVLWSTCGKLPLRPWQVPKTRREVLILFEANKPRHDSRSCRASSVNSKWMINPLPFSGFYSPELANLLRAHAQTIYKSRRFFFSRASGNFEEQNKVLDPSIIVVNYCITNARHNYIA